jgi:pyruvate formate lyase activating enzyme
VELKGWVRTSLIDYPEHIATVLFTAGCNFRCPMCHNAELVMHPGELSTLPEEQVWAFLERRIGLIDGVVISGGEPTIQPDLHPFLRRLRERDLAMDVKLDTNGYRPDVLASLLGEGLVDYVAMDVKAPPEKYPLLVGKDRLDVTCITRSIGLLRDNGGACEFRTTVIPGLLVEQDVEEIARWIEGAGRYVLQQFRPQGALDPDLRAVSPYPRERLQQMVARAERWVEQVTVRGL